jgi:hypothetical protein
MHIYWERRNNRFIGSSMHKESVTNISREIIYPVCMTHFGAMDSCHARERASVLGLLSYTGVACHVHCLDVGLNLLGFSRSNTFG